MSLDKSKVGCSYRGCYQLVIISTLRQAIIHMIMSLLLEWRSCTTWNSWVATCSSSNSKTVVELQDLRNLYKPAGLLSQCSTHACMALIIWSIWLDLNMFVKMYDYVADLGNSFLWKFQSLQVEICQNLNFKQSSSRFVLSENNIST